MRGFKLSPQQKQVWRLVRTDGSAYRAQCAVWMEGAVRHDVLLDALRAVAARHEILRTAFVQPSELTLPLQIIAEDMGPHVEMRGSSGAPAEAALSADA